MPEQDIVERLKLLPSFPPRVMPAEAREICPAAAAEILRLRALLREEDQVVYPAIPGPPMRR